MLKIDLAIGGKKVQVIGVPRVVLLQNFYLKKKCKKFFLFLFCFCGKLKIVLQ